MDAHAGGTPHATADAGMLEVLSQDECRRLLASAVIGRVAVTVGAMPAILPVNYKLLGDCIVFRTAPGTKLQAALRNAVVAFEVDEIDESAQQGWSVLVVGVATELTGDDRDRAVALPLEPWAPEGRDHVVGIVPDMISGRRLVSRR